MDNNYNRTNNKKKLALLDNQNIVQSYRDNVIVPTTLALALGIKLMVDLVDGIMLMVDLVDEKMLVVDLVD